MIRFKKVLFSFLLLMILPLSPIFALDLTVDITNLRNTNGQIIIGLYNNKETFPKKKAQFREVIAHPDNRNFSIIINDLPEGTYAIALMHDENNNGEFDQGLLGLPLEGYGFSNNAKPFFGPPSFKKAAFTLTPTQNHITIKMAY